jgi:hypothetical protein
MAENNETPFSPLDSLGSEYGGINAPNTDDLSYKPFEGDRIKMPEINFSASPVPPASSINLPQLDIKNTVTGVKPNKPGPQPGQSPKDIASALNDYGKALSQVNQDKNSYSKIYSYDAGPAGNNFYKRYAAYGQEKFDEVGFTPLRDNEALFNERTTKFNDFTRMMQHSFLPLLGQGFVSGPKSLWKMAQGDFTSGDLEDAKMYEEAAAIGQSTKGGAFGFINNAALNFGYTAGIISEIAAEELIAAGITAVTEGGAAPLLVGVTERNIGRLGLAGVRMSKFISKGDDIFRGAVRSLEASDTARAFYRAANTKVGRVLNPLSNTLDAMNTVRTAGEFGNLSSLAKVSRTFGGFYRDVRNVNAALSEARLEAGMVENKVYENLYDDFYKRNGSAPTNDQQYEMIKQSKQASLETLGWNTALVYASNKITFDNLLNPKGGISKILGNKTKDILNLGTGKVILKKTYEAGSKIAKGEFKFFENTIKGSVERIKELGFKESFKDLAAKSVKGTANYFKANVAEGLQENAQETIAQAMERYHTDAFDSKAVKAHLYSKGAAVMGMRDQSSYFAEAWREQNPLTAKGFETFATGFVMGAFAGPMNKLPNWASTGYNRIFKPEKYAEYKKLKSEYGEQVAQTLTDLYNNPKDFLDSKIFNLGNQEIYSKIKENGGRKEALDASDQAFVSQVYTALRSGSFDTFKEHLASFKELTPEEFEGAMKGIPKGEGAKYQARIDSALTRANEIQKAYDQISERYPNPIDLEQYEEGTDAYKKAAIFQSAWENAKMNAIFMNENYKDSIKRIEQIKNYIRGNKPLAKMSDSDLQVLLQPERMANERDLLKAEIEAQRDTLSPSELQKKELKLQALEELSDAYDYYQRYEVIDREKFVQQAKANGAIKQLAEENGITEEEAEDNIRQYIDKELKVKSKNAENSLEAEAQLETAYKKYLQAIANATGDIYLDENAERAFEMLLDSYKLGKEASILASNVNILRNPREFIKHVERNYDWMGSLYENRKEYFDNLVGQELNNIELNALLNELADRNVYISADDAAEFQRMGRIPDEFFDNTRKAVIKPGHPEYNTYAEMFERAAAVRNYRPDARAADITALNLALARLDAEMRMEIERLAKTETTEELGKISLGDKESISIKVLRDQLEVGDYVDAEYLTKKDKRKKVKLYMSEEGLRYENEQGDLVNVDRFEERFVAGRRYRVSLKPDAAEVAAIEKLYSEKRVEAINKLNEKAKTEKLTLASRYIEFTTKTPIMEMENDLVNQLDKAFSNYIEDNDMSDEFEQMSKEDKFEEFEKFVQTNKEAEVIISKYNKRRIDQLIAEQLDEIEAPVITINNEEVDFEELDVKGIKSNIAKLERDLQKLTSKPEEEKTAEDKEEIAKLEFYITSANKYLNYKLNTKDSPKRIAVIKKLKKLLDRQNDIFLDESVNKYDVNGKKLDRVTRAIQKLVGKEYSYSKTKEVQDAYDSTLGQGGTVDDLIKALKSKRLPGFSTWTYNELERELKILTGEVSAEEQPIADETLPEGFRYVEEDEILPAGDYITRISVDGKRTITNAPSPKNELEERVDRANETIAKAFESKFNMDLNEDQPGKYINGQFVPANAGAQLFGAVNQALSTSRTSVDPEQAKKLYKEYVKTIHPDKYTDEDIKVIADIYFKALNEAKNKGRVDVLQELKNSFDQELSTLQKRVRAITPKVEEVKSKPTRKVSFDEVISLVKEKTYEDRRIAGIYIDQQIRNFLAGVEVKKNPEMIEDDVFDSLFGPDSVLGSIKEKIDSGENIILPNNIKLFDENAGVAGEIDLLLVDRNGKVFIIDIKTGDSKKWNRYNDPKSEYAKKEEYALQLTAYKNMLYNMLGIEAELAVLPLQITTDSETGKIVTLSNADGVLQPGKGTFKVLSDEPSILKDAEGKPILDENGDVQFGKTFQEKIDSIIPRISPSGEAVTEEVAVKPEEQKKIEEEVKKLTAEQKKSQDKNMLSLINRIQLLRERQKTLDQDASNINDTLKFLDTILDNSIKLNMAEFKGLIDNINNLDKVTAQLIKSKLTPRKGKRSLSAKELRAQLRREFAIAGDVLTRVKDLKREKELLEAEVKDLKEQGDYYQNLLDDPNMTLFNRTEINNKINKVSRKISTIEKLIKNIQNAISKSVAYIKEYLKVWDKANTRLEKFKEETGYKPLSSEEIRSLIDSVDAADQAALKDYPNLTRQFNKLESDVIETMDTVELLDEVKEAEETRLNELQTSLARYQKQLRYLNELLEPIAEDLKSNPISDKTSESPKPTETKKTAAENQKQTVEAVERSAENKVLFSLSDITDLGVAIEQPDQLSKQLVSVLDQINSAETVEDVKSLTKDLSSFKPSEIKRINTEAREKIKSLGTEFKESVENQVDTLDAAEYVVVKSFDGIPTGTMIAVTSVDGNDVTIKIVNDNQQKTVKFDTLNGNIMTPEEAKTKTVAETIEITPEAKQKIAESKTAADRLTDSEIDNIIEEVKDKDLDQLEDDLYNLEIC